MALSTATITLNISDMLGVDFDARRTKVWVTTNVDGDAVVDTVGNAIRLGSGTVTLGSDGTATLAVWVPGAGANPASWQTYVHIDYSDGAKRTREVRRFGPFTITGNADLADLIAEQEIPPNYQAGFVAQAQGFLDQQESLAGIDSSDSATAYNTQYGPLTKAALIASFVGQGSNIDFTNGDVGAGRAQMAQIVHKSASGYILHLVTGPDPAQTGYLIAMGRADAGASGKGGLLISDKSGSSNAAIRYVNAAGALGQMLYASHVTTDSTTPLLYLESANPSGKTTALIGLFAGGTPGTRQKMFNADTIALNGRSNGLGVTMFSLMATGDAEFSGPNVRVNGAVLDVADADAGYTWLSKSRVRAWAAGDEAYLELYRYSGLSGQGYSSRLRTNPNGDPTEMALQTGNGIATLGAHAYSTTLRAKSISGAPAMALLGAAPRIRSTFAAATGTATRTTFDTTTVTTAQLAERVKALIDDLGATSGFGLLSA